MLIDGQGTDNQTIENGTPGETTGVESIENIMGNMAAENKPDAKPDGNTAEGLESQSAEIQQNPAWMAQLPKELRDNPDFVKQLAKFNTIGDIAKSYSELEGKLGKSLIQPAENAGEEEINSFYQKLGKPETAAGYQLENDENNYFAEIAYKNNLTVAQAQAMWKQITDAGTQMQQQQQVSIAQQAKATQDALQAEYGKDYNAKVQMLQRGVNAYGGKALGEKLKATGLIADLDVVKMFIRLGEMNADAGTTTKTSNAVGYKSISQGGHLNFGNDFK